jgi:phenylpyruvate tautomerase PptA (4-oxalocrotonate tautomerase family)
MPFLTIKTNGISNDVNVAEKAANVVADVLGKPVSYVCAEIKYNENLAFGGSRQSKGAWIELASIGFRNKQAVVDVLTDFAVERLGVEREFVCISLSDLAAADVAHGGHLFG